MCFFPGERPRSFADNPAEIARTVLAARLIPSLSTSIKFPPAYCN